MTPAMTVEQELVFMRLERRAIQAETQSARNFLELCTLRTQLLDQRIQQLQDKTEVPQ